MIFLASRKENSLAIGTILTLSLKTLMNFQTKLKNTIETRSLIQLELSSPRLFSLSQWGILISLILLTFYGVHEYTTLIHSISEHTAIIEQKKIMGQPRKKPLKLSGAEEIALQNAQRTVNYSWSQPFQLIEDASTDKVTLFDVAPDIEKRELKIQAQATDLLGMFNYAKKLNNSKNARRVIFNTEDIQEDQHQPVAFSLTVNW